MNFARYDSLWLNLHAASGKNNAIKPASNHDAISLNLSFDFCVFAEDHSLLRDNVAFDVSVNAKRSGQRQRAFERDALIYKTRPLLTATILRRPGPLPCHM